MVELVQIQSITLITKKGSVNELILVYAGLAYMAYMHVSDELSNQRASVANSCIKY